MQRGGADKIFINTSGVWVIKSPVRITAPLYPLVREILDVVAGLRKYPNGRDACVIGEVKAEPRVMVVLETIYGGARIVDMLVGEQAPRIC